MKFVKNTLTLPIVAVSVAIFAAINARADVLEVGSGKAYSDIQSAIDAAVDGQDEVLVYDGTYEITDSLVLEKGITLRSVNGADVTTVRNSFVVPNVPKVQETHRCIMVSNENAVVEGFTFAHGYVYDNGVNPADGEKFGAGVLLWSGKLIGCTVTDCRMGKSNSGGALAMLSMAALASNCVVTANQSLPGGYGYTVLGVGIYARAGEITDSEISDNIYNGSTYPRGAGVHIADSGDSKIKFTMRRCKVVRNICEQASYVNYWGVPGGIYANGRNSLVENTLIAENETAGNGGGVYVSGAEYTYSTFVNCTIVNNKAGYGGGIFFNNKYGRFVNCILQGNEITGGDTCAYKPQISQYGAYGTFVNCLCPLDLSGISGSSGNEIGSATFQNGTYKLAGGSAGYDAGTTSGYSWLETTVDLDKADRIWGERIDIGCYEYFTTGLDISIVAAPQKSDFIVGESLALTAVLIPADDGAVLEWKIGDSVVGTGEIYRHTFADVGDVTVQLVVTDSNDKTYDPVEYACFVRPDVLYVVNPALNPGHVSVPPFNTQTGAATNIAEAIAAAGDGSVIHVAEGDYPIFEQLTVDKGVKVIADAGRDRTVVRRGKSNVRMRILELNHANALVSGFTLKDGSMNVSSSKGAGVYIRGNGGTLTNCTVTGCNLNADQQIEGAGVYFQSGLIVDCKICNNTNAVPDNTYLLGCAGGIRQSGGEIRNCEITGNAMIIRNGEVRSRKQPGGGVYSTGGVIVGCLIADNVCECAQGGGLYALSTLVTVSNCTFAGNSAYVGGGLYVDDDNIGTRRPTSVCNSVASGNTSEAGYADVKVVLPSTVVTYCFGPEGELPEGEGNIFGTDAGFFAPERGNYRPKRFSPLVDKGANDMWMIGSADLLGRPRVVGKTVDIGCYENQQLGMMLLLR